MQVMGSISKTLSPRFAVWPPRYPRIFILKIMVTKWKKYSFEDTAMLIPSQEVQAYDGIGWWNYLWVGGKG